MYLSLLTVKYMAITALVLTTLTREAQAVRTLVTALSISFRSFSG